MRKFLLFLNLIIVLLFVFISISLPPQVKAERVIGPTDLENSYCSGDKWYRKTDCRPVQNGQCDANTGVGCLWDCDIQETTEKCHEADPNRGSEVNSALGKVNPPKAVTSIGFGEVGINNLLAKVVQLIFVVATVGFVFMVLLSAVQMILSGGDKEAIGKARGRLTWAIIGIVLLSLSFVIFRVLGDITGFKFAL